MRIRTCALALVLMSATASGTGVASDAAEPIRRALEAVAPKESWPSLFIPYAPEGLHYYTLANP